MHIAVHDKLSLSFIRNVSRTTIVSTSKNPLPNLFKTLKQFNMYENVMPKMLNQSKPQ